MIKKLSLLLLIATLSACSPNENTNSESTENEVYPNQVIPFFQHWKLTIFNNIEQRHIIFMLKKVLSPAREYMC